MISKQRRAITLVEILIAASLSLLIAGAAFTLYKSGVRASVSGVINLDTMAEGRKILLQIRDDLKNSCIPYQGSFSLSFNDLLQIDFSKNRGLEGAEFSLLRFRHDSEFVQIGLPDPNYLLRPLLNVRYRLEKTNAGDLLKLVRETGTGTSQAKSKVLSERVSFFNIKPVRIPGPGNYENWLWNITLHLGQISESLSEAASPNIRGTNILEFYEVVSSDFYTAINNHPNSPRNWHTGLRYAPE